MTGANSCSLQQQQQLPVHPALRVTHRALLSSSAVSETTQRTHAVPSTTLDDNISLSANMGLQHINSANLELQESDLDTIAAVNSITQGFISVSKL